MELNLEEIVIGTSRAIQDIRKLIVKIAESNSSVLIHGPSGTGKTLVASLIHQLSARKNKPFVPVNCGAIPSELLESELFGHEKGAFTGALNRRQGRFELAHQGTLFLDEIGDMPLAMQVKLLRVLQEGAFERVGSNQVIHVDVRIIAATHQNIEQAIIDHRFREDLFYRLNVLPLEIPSLAERPEDIVPLITHVQQKLCDRTQRKLFFSEHALKALSHYSWPGNIRELINFMERLAVLHEGETIEYEDLPIKYRHASANHKIVNFQSIYEISDQRIDLKEILAQIEKNLIIQALEKHHYTVSYAAEHLGIGRTTLIDKIRKYGLHHKTNVEPSEIN